MTRKTLLAATSLAALTAAIAVPAVSAAPAVRAKVVDGTLRVTGSPFADRIALRLSATDPTQLHVDIDADGSADATFDTARFGSIFCPGGTRQRLRPPRHRQRRLHDRQADDRVRGRGDDILLGGSGNETFFGGRGNDFVDGNGGADAVFLGSGDDTFVWDPGDGSHRRWWAGLRHARVQRIRRQRGLRRDGVGHRLRFTRNLGGIVMDLNDIEALDVNALDGTDSVTIDDLTGTGLADVSADLGEQPGSDFSDGAADAVQIEGTAGIDTIAATANGGAVDVAGLAASVGS